MIPNLKKTRVADFDKQFHSDHAKLNRILKKAGIKLRYKVIK